jgi:iron complex outermembrane receptor protein
MIRLAIATLAAGVSLTATSAALAQVADADQDAQAAAPDKVVSDTTVAPGEIVVTARKREERLQDVPLSVTAFTGDKLRELGIRDITEVALQTPGFAMQNNSRQAEQPFIRGMSVNSVFRQAQNASFFVDGVYVSGVGRTIGLDDIERIEVVLGPQAVYYGRATFGGAIGYISRKPRLGEFAGDAQTTLGEHGLFDLSGSVNVPVGERFGMRLYAQHHNYNGEFRNSVDGRKLGDEETNGMSASARWEPVDGLNIVGRVQYTRFDDGHSANTIYNPLTNNNCRPNAAGRFQFFCGELRNPTEADLNLNLSALKGGGYRRVRQSRYHLFADYEFGSGFSISSLTAYNKETQGLSSDGDATRNAPQGGLLQSLFESEFDDFQQEVRLSSPQDRRIRALVGGFHFNSDRIDSSLVFPIVSLSNPRKIKNDAVFGSLAFDITPQLTLTGEGRYQSDRIRVSSATTGAELFRSKTNAFLPRGTLDFKASEDILLYATVARGNKPSDFNTAAGTPVENRVVKEERLWNYEVGAKTQWLDRRLTVNATGYWIDWSNQAYQDTVFQRDAAGNLILAPGGQPRTVVVTINAGQTRIRGLELDSNLQILPGWSARLAYSFIEAEYRDFLSRLPLTYQATPLQVRGNWLQNTPRHKLTASTTFDQPIGSGLNLFGSTDVTLRGKQYTDELNTAYVGTLTLVNARLGLSGEGWQAFVFGRNLTNSRVPDFATRSLDFNTNVNSYLFTLRPTRSFGVTASASF